MKQIAKFGLGVPLQVVNEPEAKTRLGFVVGVKLSERKNNETNKTVPLHVYMLSGHGDTWFYEDCLAKVPK